MEVQHSCDYPMGCSLCHLGVCLTLGHGMSMMSVLPLMRSVLPLMRSVIPLVRSMLPLVMSVLPLN